MVALIYVCACMIYVYIYLSRNIRFPCTDAVLVMSDVDLAWQCVPEGC